MFDGVHLGHRAVLGAAGEAARADGGGAAVLTFSPHPSRLFKPAAPVRLIQGDEEKARLFMQLGLSAVISQPFDTVFAAVTAEHFLPLLRQHLPGLVALYVGENFRFGQGRRGDVALLERSGATIGVRVNSASRVSYRGEPISSSRIRACLEAGELAEANVMLGAPYVAAGPVLPGRQLGRTIGFPTLNLAWTPDLSPRYGVYAVRVSGSKSPLPLPGVANYGVRPTVESAATVPVLETHLLGACPFTAGDGIKVEWLRFLRPEQKFANLDELRGQIARDCQAAAVPS